MRLQLPRLIGAWLPWIVAGMAACLPLGAGAQALVDDAASAAPQPPRVSPGVWVVMGSSSAVGVGGGMGRGWASLLQAKMHDHGVSLLNLAKSGATSYAGLSVNQSPVVADRPPPESDINIDTALSLQPKLLLISYPSNDTAKGYAPQETLGNIVSISQQAAKRRVPVIVLSSQPRKLPADQLARISELNALLSSAFGPCFVDVYSVLSGPNGQYTPEVDAGDGIHPNLLGHERIYEQVQQLINSRRCVLVGKS